MQPEPAAFDFPPAGQPSNYNTPEPERLSSEPVRATTVDTDEVSRALDLLVIS